MDCYDVGMNAIIIAYGRKKRRFRAAADGPVSWRPVMSLTSSRMRAVNAVFDAGSFSRAARRLGMSQPAITQQVRGLENHFGVTLSRELSRNNCVARRTWGSDDDGIWVSNGCRAEFTYRTRL